MPSSYQNLVYLSQDISSIIEEIDAKNIALREIIEEATAAISQENLQPGYKTHDDIPIGLRSIAHIRLATIREIARKAVNK